MHKPPLSHFDDIHSHSLRGPRIITSIDTTDLNDESLPGDEREEAWYSVGYHPWNTIAGREAADEALRTIDRLADNPRVVAIGEAGLDALRGADAAEQERVFVAQAEIAERHGLPLIVHCVRRYGRLLELHKELKPSVLWVVHGFRGKAELARQLTAVGIGVSLPEPRADLEHLPASLVFYDSD